MATSLTTEQYYDGTASQTNFAFTFPYTKESDVKVEHPIGTVLTQKTASAANDYEFLTATTIKFTQAPASGTDNVKIYRATNVDSAKAVFASGSTIRASDLNSSLEHVLFSRQDKIQTDDLTDQAITAAKIKNDTITASQLATDSVGALELADNSVASANIINGSIVDADINASAAIAGSKLAASTSSVAGSMSAADKAKLDGIETGATADQTNAEIRAAVEAASDSNVFTDADHSKLNAIETNATADQTNAEIRAAVEAASDSNVFTDADHTKLNSIASSANNYTHPNHSGDVTSSGDGATTIANDAVTYAKMQNVSATDRVLGRDSSGAGIVEEIAPAALRTMINVEDGATADQSNTEIKTAYEANSNTNAFTDANKTLVDAITATATELNVLDGVTASTAELNMMDNCTAVGTELSVLDGITANTSELNILDGVTSSTAELNLLDGKSIVTSIASNATDSQLPSAQAVNERIVTVMQDAGGFVPIADDQSFPNTNPDPNDDAGTIVSIADAGGLVVNGSGVTTTGRTLGGSTVTINGIDSSLYSSTIAAGKGMLVETTSTLNTYTYHRLVVDEAGVANAQTLVNDFNNRYRVGSSNPTSSLDDGDLFFNTTSDKMLVYNATGSSWDEVQSVGNFFINTISSYSGTGGNSATFNGSAYRFVLSNAGTYAQQHIVSVNGVIQKPNSGTSQPAEGFAIDGSSIIFSSAPASGSDYFIITVGASVNIGAPSNNTVTSAMIVDGSIVNADVSSSAAIASSKLAKPIDLANNEKVRFGGGNDLEIYFDGSHSRIKNTTGVLNFQTDTFSVTNGANSETILSASNNGSVDLYYNDSKKLETTSTGATVSGDDLLLSGGGHSKLKVLTTGTSHATGIQITHASGDAAQQVWQLQTDGTTDGDLKLRNATSSTDIFYVQPDNNVRFQDNRKLLFGTGSDLQIYHDGSYSYIDNTHSGGLWIRGGTSTYQIGIQAKNSENSILCTGDGSAALYYDGSKKLETSSTGTTTSGTVQTDGDVKFTVSGNASARHKFIGGQGANLELGTYSSSNSSRDVHLEIDSAGDLFVDDNQKFTFGTGNDLQIYHNGTDNYIYSNNKILRIQGNGSAIKINPVNAENCANFNANGSVELYYDNSKKFETTSTGATLLGDLLPDTDDTYDLGSASKRFSELWLRDYVYMPDDGRIRLGAGFDFQIFHDGSHNAILGKTGHTYVSAPAGQKVILSKSVADNFQAESMLTAATDGAVELYYDNTKTFETVSGGSKVTGTLEITSYISQDDNVKHYWGTGDDAAISHDGTNFIIRNTTGNTRIEAKSGELGARCIPDGATELYYNNGKKFETTSDGSTVSGSLITGSGVTSRENADSMLTVAETSGHCEVNIIAKNDSGSVLNFGDPDDYNVGRIKYAHDDNTLRFDINGSEGARFTTDGSLCISCTAGNVTRSDEGISLNADGAMVSTRDGVMHYLRSLGTGSYTGLQIWSDTNVVGSMTFSSSGTNWNQSSDYRLKENAVAISDGITRLKTLKPYRFNWKTSPSKTVDGFFAHEVTAVPEAVTGTKDAVASEADNTVGTSIGDPIYQQLDVSKLVPLLTAALQEAVTKIETLEAKVAALEAK